ncbi:helix-turn-helix transcriptional regulator [Methylobacterium sp. Leaf100]|uniref:helix-turn-helix transcriptional regulator n=1 Tax=Methylobacterium sp. Leaf100 TaxID=1736252 RepID=UPI0012E22804|nr:helix-turn-helix transcriptional regulator [Methylobacterium sp. Leaf100]
MHTNFMEARYTACEYVAMPQVSLPADRKEEIASRVRVLRKAYFETQVAAAGRCQVSTNTWNHYEKGRSPPSDPVMMKLKVLHGITRDWIMDGSLYGMPPDTQERLLKTPDPGTRSNRRRDAEKTSA